MLLKRASLLLSSSSSSLSLSSCCTNKYNSSGRVRRRGRVRSSGRVSEGFGDERKNQSSQRFDIRPELVKITKATASSLGETPTSFSPLPPVNPLLDDMPDPSSYLVMSSQPVILFYSSETKELATKVASENANIELGEISWE